MACQGSASLHYKEAKLVSKQFVSISQFVVARFFDCRPNVHIIVHNDDSLDFGKPVGNVLADGVVVVRSVNKK